MEVKEFLEVLKKNKDKALLFEYSESEFAGTNYHLTEVKNVTFDSVDCGGKANAWQETHIQLWESPTEEGKNDYITTNKALSILERVHGIKPLLLETEAKIEFGNAHFHTAVMSIVDIDINNETCIVKLFSNATQCKALEACGVLVESGVKEQKEEACCSGSGCC